MNVKYILKTELFPEGNLVTFDDGTEAVYPTMVHPVYGPYVELLPNDLTTHLDQPIPLSITPEELRSKYPERTR